jgi:hypothetical protein
MSSSASTGRRRPPARWACLGDTTWIDGTVRDVYLHEHGPAVDLDLTATSQRGEHNIIGQATILVASREHGPTRLPTPPETEAPDPAERWSLGGNVPDGD